MESNRFLYKLFLIFISLFLSQCGNGIEKNYILEEVELSCMKISFHKPVRFIATPKFEVFGYPNINSERFCDTSIEGAISEISFKLEITDEDGIEETMILNFNEGGGSPFIRELCVNNARLIGSSSAVEYDKVFGDKMFLDRIPEVYISYESDIQEMMFRTMGIYDGFLIVNASYTIINTPNHKEKYLLDFMKVLETIEIQIEGDSFDKSI